MTPQSEISRGRIYYDSFGAKQILTWLGTGQLYDRGRHGTKLSSGPQSGTTRVAAVTGVATFEHVHQQGRNRYTLTVIASGLTGATSTSVDGSLTLRMDAPDGGTTDDTIGFTVLSCKDGSLYYSNNWAYDSSIQGWRTIQQPMTPSTAVVIN